ncbi:hypothetical protein NMY22_g10969 [Coprinellus aureogranulatus]|nr:hypothetical protein NMY22_g10969 [Coprinellus aureogranulatus]
MNLLAGTFFFSSFLGSADRRSKQCVITTLAYQLAGHKVLHQYKVKLTIAIELNAGIFRKRLLEQARCLILDPLLSIQVDGHCDTSTWPRGILLDGLDEVQAIQYHDATREGLARIDDDDQLEILEVLHALAGCPAFPFRILISSRPERIISDFFNTTAQASTIILFLDSKYEPDADIRRFLQSKFAIIRYKSGMSNASWPGEEVINKLVEMSSGQFIVSSTVLRYIESGLPQEQLEDIMQVAQGQMGNKNPFALLDAVYTHIINRSPDSQLAVIWIRHIITDTSSPAHFWKKFFEDTDGQFYHILKNLASLLSVPPHNDHCSPIQTYHKSLTDFLTSWDRCGDLYVGSKNLDEFAARRVVLILQNRGPKVPLPSPDKLYDFLGWIPYSPLFQPDPLRRADGSRLFVPFLQYLCEPSISALAACDVGWWTRFAIVKLRSLLEGMFCYIHSELTHSAPGFALVPIMPASQPASTGGKGYWLKHEPSADGVMSSTENSGNLATTRSAPSVSLPRMAKMD